MSKKCCGSDNTVIEANTPASGCCTDTIVSSCAPVSTLPSCPAPSSCCAPSANLTQQQWRRAVSMCPEDNKQVVLVEKLVGAFKNVAAFCMPACDAKVRVLFDRVGDVPIGAWMWSFAIGNLKITGFNPLTGEIELQNECPESSCAGDVQAAPGTPIPACTVWMLSVPQCTGTNGGSAITFPYLDSGFVAPASSACVDIAVTNTNGLSVNKNVDILTGTYLLSAIKSATLVTICNEGAGLTPGTVVEYKDSAGNLLVPIVPIDSNVCLNDSVTSGKIVVCKNSNMQPLEGSENGQIPVWDSGTEEWNARTLGIPTLDCTELTVCLTLDPDLPLDTPYVVTVIDTSLFTISEPVTIGGTQFTVDSIIDATHMRIIPSVQPTAVQTYNPGSALCSGGCCDILSQQITEIIAGGFLWAGDSAGPANVFNLTLPSDITSYTNGLLVAFRAHQSNTAACVCNINGIGPISFKQATGFVDPYKGDIAANYLYFAMYENGKFNYFSFNGVRERIWTPTITMNGGATVSAVSVQVADYTIVNPFCEFQLSAFFTISGGGSGNNTITVTPPLVTGIGVGLALFPAQAEDSGGRFPAGWRYDGTNFTIGNLTASDWANGGADINIQGRFRVL